VAADCKDTDWFSRLEKWEGGVLRHLSRFTVYSFVCTQGDKLGRGRLHTSMHSRPSLTFTECFLPGNNSRSLQDLICRRDVQVHEDCGCSCSCCQATA
jgi:hypothetical protein